MLNITINWILNRIPNNGQDLCLLFSMLQFNQVKMCAHKAVTQVPTLELQIIHMQIRLIKLNQPLILFQAKKDLKPYCIDSKILELMFQNYQCSNQFLLVSL